MNKVQGWASLNNKIIYCDIEIPDEINLEYDDDIINEFVSDYILHHVLDWGWDRIKK